MDLDKNDGTEPPHALLAPFQKLPRARPRRDKASGTILEVRHGDTWTSPVSLCVTAIRTPFQCMKDVEEKSGWLSYSGLCCAVCVG